jgi:hypothetical protein
MFARQWELQSLTESGFKVVAFLNQSSLSPIGKKFWYFLNECDGKDGVNMKELKLSQVYI